jgi:predicted ATPase
MLTRLYIDNFRCFEKFEYRPARKQLILGANGSGKSSLMDALRYVRLCAARGFRVDKWFKLNQRTRWLTQCEQVFVIEATLQRGSYRYELVIEPWGEPASPRVRRELLELNEDKIFEFEEGEVVYYREPGKLREGIDFDPSRSALATVGRFPALQDFVDWLSNVRCFHINPFDIGSRAEREYVNPSVSMGNMAAWYRHLVQAHPKENAAFLKDLRESLDGFEHLSLENAGENVRILNAEFTRSGRDVKVGFSELSDGQRCLICLYAILHFIIAKGGTVIIDEPENFISLREIQPWLMAAADMADDHKGQVLLISHHPELINQWAPSYGVQFVRDGAGPVRVERFQGNPEYGLPPSELVARGWDRE